MYQQLGCPPESEWGKHGGTLRQLADALLCFSPNMGTFSTRIAKRARIPHKPLYDKKRVGVPWACLALTNNQKRLVLD